jgi:hypothetical protein
VRGVEISLTRLRTPKEYCTGLQFIPKWRFQMAQAWLSPCGRVDEAGNVVVKFPTRLIVEINHLSRFIIFQREVLIEIDANSRENVTRPLEPGQGLNLQLEFQSFVSPGGAFAIISFAISRNIVPVDVGRMPCPFIGRPYANEPP